MNEIPEFDYKEAFSRVEKAFEVQVDTLKVSYKGKGKKRRINYWRITASKPHFRLIVFVQLINGEWKWSGEVSRNRQRCSVSFFFKGKPEVYASPQWVFRDQNTGVTTAKNPEIQELANWLGEALLGLGFEYDYFSFPFNFSQEEIFGRRQKCLDRINKLNPHNFPLIDKPNGDAVCFKCSFIEV